VTKSRRESSDMERLREEKEGRRERIRPAPRSGVK